ncbi:MAG: hypothetical protein M1814_001324 [Vezdaea aestivalis]|nr:MAG: hypothetical protein M1814_001324 [Vezdaea aestivalis]
MAAIQMLVCWHHFMNSHVLTDMQATLLRYLDLTKSFPVQAPLSYTTVKTIRPDFEVTPSLLNQTLSQAGEFWYSKDSLFLYAGFGKTGAPNIPTNGLTYYNTTSQKWGVKQVGGGDYNAGERYEGSFTSVPDQGLAFHLGGDFNTPSPGLLTFNISNPNTPRWTNQTLGNSTQGLPVPVTLQGVMTYLPVGESGILLEMGGYNQRALTFAKGGFWPTNDLDKVNIFDIASQTWLQMPITGNKPPQLDAFCLGVVPSPDKSSFQVYLYGGWNLGQGRAYSDVYILAVPSFRWIKVTSTNDPEGYGIPRYGRYRHKCAVWKDTQMFVLGGLVKSGTNEIQGVANCTNIPPIRVFDTAQLIWKTTFDPSPSTPYSVPKIVSDVIGGNASGGATIKSPFGGWPSAQLETIFSKMPSTPSPTSVPLVYRPIASSKSRLPVGAIASIAIASFFVLFFAALAFFWRRRAHKRAAQAARDAATVTVNWSTDSKHPSNLQSSYASEMPSPVQLPQEGSGTQRFPGELQGSEAGAELEGEGIIAELSAGDIGPLPEEGRPGGRSRAERWLAENPNNGTLVEPSASAVWVEQKRKALGHP